VTRTKMTLEELRALRQIWRGSESLNRDDVLRRFVELSWRCGYGDAPAEMTLDEIKSTDLGMCGAVGVWLDDAPDTPEVRALTAFANDAARTYLNQVGRFRTAATAALEWLKQNDRIAKTYLVARLSCPRGKILARTYCLPEDIVPVRDSGGHRLLIEPNSRGNVTSLGPKGTAGTRWARRAGAWWYISDDDVWELRCKCCPRPDGGVRAGDFLGVGAQRGYTAVLL
jgi:hypothetical protein